MNPGVKFPLAALNSLGVTPYIEDPIENLP